MPTNSAQDRELAEARIQIATLEVQFTNLAAQFGKLEITLATLSTKLDAVNTTLTEARGGWKVMMLIGGAGTAAGGVLAWLIQHVKG